MAVLQSSVECRVRVDNRDIANAISSVRLEQHIDRHHELQIRFRILDDDRGAGEFADADLFSSYLGKSISVNLVPSGGIIDSSLSNEFIGIVTEVRLENSVQEMNFATLVAKSPTIALDGAPHNKFHLDKTAKEIVSEMLQMHKITVGTLEATSGTMAFSVQYRETEYQYVMRLATGSGLFAFYDGQKFHMMKANSSLAQNLTWRQDLGRFAMGLGTASYDFESQSWDPDGKAPLDSALTGLPNGASKPSLRGDPFKASEEIYTKVGFTPSSKATDLSSVDAALERKKKAVTGGMVVCHGESIVPAVQVGRCVNILNMDKLNGHYWVKSVLHSFDDSGSYHNNFEAIPLGMAFPAPVASRAPITDLQTAIVTDNNDPDTLGRIKVKFPWSKEEDIPWLRVMTPHAGKERGWYCIPEVDDEVLVGFEHGNPDMPVVLGSLYNGVDKPPSKAVIDDNKGKMFMTVGENQILFDDTSGSEKITIAQKDGKNTIVLELGGPSISIESDDDVSIKGKTIALESTQGDITVKSAGAVKQEATQDMQLKGGMNFKAEGSLNCDLKGGAQSKLEGGAMVTVKGALVKIN